MMKIRHYYYGWLHIVLFAALSAAGACAQPAGPLKSESPMIKADMGIAITPRNFPSHSALDVVGLTTSRRLFTVPQRSFRMIIISGYTDTFRAQMKSCRWRTGLHRF